MHVVQGAIEGPNNADMDAEADHAHMMEDDAACAAAPLLAYQLFTAPSASAHAFSLPNCNGTSVGAPFTAPYAAEPPAGLEQVSHLAQQCLSASRGQSLRKYIMQPVSDITVKPRVTMSSA